MASKAMNICEECGKKIAGKMIYAGGAVWHPSCFPFLAKPKGVSKSMAKKSGAMKRKKPKVPAKKPTSAGRPPEIYVLIYDDKQTDVTGRESAFKRAKNLSSPTFAKLVKVVRKATGKIVYKWKAASGKKASR